MTDLPFPSGNLYKAVATAGLVITVLCLGLYFYFGYQSQYQIAELEGEVVMLTGQKPSYELTVSKATPDRIRQDLLSLQQSLTQAQGKVAVIGSLVKQSGELRRQLLKGTVLGVLLMAVGFGLWYARVQQYQDQLLKRQVENA